MARYQVEYNGAKYQIESPTELTEAQIMRQLQAQTAPKEPPPTAPKGTKYAASLAAEALGGLSDLDNMLPAPFSLGAGIQAATGVKGPPLQGEPSVHNSMAGRAVRFAAPAAVLPGQTMPGRIANAVGSGMGGAVDFKAEQAGLPWYQRIPATIAPSLGVGLLTAGTKGMIRGGPSKGAEMEENIANYENMGVKDFSVAQVAPEGNSRIPLVERALSFAFGGQGPYQKLGEKQSAQLKATAEKLAGGTADDAEAAGKRVWDGLFGEKGWVSRSKTSERGLWQQVDSKFTNVKAVKTKALEKALNEIVQSYDNPDIAAAVNADKVGASKLLAAIKAANGQMSYDDFIALRKDLGELQSGSGLVPSERGISANQAGKLWGAMMDDYRGITKSLGADKEFAAAHSFSKNYHETSRNFFKTIYGKDAEPTKIIDEIASGNFQQPAKLRALRDALDPADYGKIQEYVINRLGTPSGSKTGSFSLETFHTNYNNRFAGAGKSGEAVADAMFGPKGTAVRDGLEAMFKVAEKTKQGSALLFNTSGTSGSGIAGASIQAILGDLARKGINIGTGAAVGAATMGGGAGVATGILAGAGLTNASARLMTSPRFARWVAKSSLQPETRLPNLITVLSHTKLESPDLEELKQEFIRTYAPDFGKQRPAVNPYGAASPWYGQYDARKGM